MWATLLLGFLIAIPISHAQFTGGFAPSNAPYGGFGGGSSCSNSSKTPVILLHGNANSAGNWYNASSTGDGLSPVSHLTSAGYSIADCTLFALTWLSPLEQSLPSLNYHRESKAQMVGDFVGAVVNYTGVENVIVIGHSMGVTVGLHGLDYTNRWNQVSTFISISGAMLGLSVNCNEAGYANPLAPTCAAQFLLDSNKFGFFPGDNAFLVTNPRMSSSGFVTYPSAHPSTRFYSINAGVSDEIVCPDHTTSTCVGLTFNTTGTSNVAAQLMVGQGDPSVNTAGTDDTTGVGHFRAKTDTGAIQVNMAQGCDGTACCNGYDGAICQVE